MNRIAWLGQAAVCFSKGVPSVFRSGWNLLSETQKTRANQIAFEYLNIWLKNNGMEDVKNLDDALTSRQSTIY